MVLFPMPLWCGRTTSPRRSRRQSQQAQCCGAAEAEYKKLISQADALVTQYDYDGAIELLDGYSGTNAKYKEMVDSKKSDLVKEQQKLSEIKDVSTIPNLSFHVLMADASRACNKDVSGEYAGLYNKNFVSVEEFSRILNQLYTGNYVLVDFDSFIYSNVGRMEMPPLEQNPFICPRAKSR